MYASAFFIFMVPHGFVTLSIITAIYPRLSRAAQDRDVDLLRTEYRRGLALPTVLTIPATFALVVFALPVVTLLFSSRDPREIPAMALVLAVMAPGIVPFGIDVLNQRFFYAHDDGRMVFFEQVVLSVVASGIALLALGCPAGDHRGGGGDRPRPQQRLQRRLRDVVRPAAGREDRVRRGGVQLGADDRRVPGRLGAGLPRHDAAARRADEPMVGVRRARRRRAWCSPSSTSGSPC